MNVRCASLAPLLVLAAAACGGANDDRNAASGASGSAATQTCEPADARAIVGRLGQAMRRVSLLAPDSVVAREMREAYSQLVTSELLASWIDEPESAAGRKVSSPWPRRIEVDSVQSCTVFGTVMYATSTDTTADLPRERVSIRVAGSPPRIAGYETIASSADDANGGGGGTSAGDAGGASTSESTDAAAAADVIRRYYAAIDARDFRKAYDLWGSGSAPQSFENFRDGFTDTRDVRVTVGSPDRIEGAAGSRYVQIPVDVNATLESGARQRFTGRYTLRRSVVDGATAAQREWHIYSASLARAP